MSKVEGIRGVEGCCLVLDDTRIAGPKPWGGGTVIHAWETNKEYKAVDTQSRWRELFGTPERAARTLADVGCTPLFDCCETCSLGTPCDDYLNSYGGSKTLEEVMLEWLRGGSDGVQDRSQLRQMR